MTALPAARMEFAPPPTPGLVRALALAIVAHALLLVALAVGVQWNRDAPTVSVSAELWASVPQQAAPPTPVPEPPLPPAEVVKPPPAPVAPPAPPTPDPSIAIAKEKLRLQKEREKEKQLQLEKLDQEKRLKAKKLQDEKDAHAKASAAEQKKLDEMRKQQMQRMAGLAAGTGEAGSTGTAAQSAGPSAGYVGKIVAKILANTSFSNPNANKPTVRLLVWVASGGSIMSSQIITSSGNNAYDEAVLRGLEKMRTIPLDIDGKIPGKMLREGLDLKVSM